jgi:outer membrane protein assembly factor BamB
MDRRRFLELCGAGAGLLAGCSTDLGDRSPTSPGTPTGSAERDPTTDPSLSTETPTPPPPLDGSWESYRHDAGNTGGSDDPGPPEGPTGIWTRVTATGDPVVSPADLDDAFVVATHTGVLYAREASSGAVRWSRAWPAETGVAPVGTGGTVVAAAGDEVAGLRADTGPDRWRSSYDAPVEGLAATGDGVVVATGNGLAAVAPRDGTERWRHPTDGTVATPPAVGPVAVAVGLSSGDVLAAEPDTGERRWKASVGAPPEFAPAVGDGLVYAATESDLVALDAGDGSRAWSVGTSHPVAAPPVTTDDGVCICTVNPDAEPERVGSPPPGGTGTRTPTAEDARWFEADLIALSAEDGSERWRAERTEGYSFTSGPPESLPLATADGRVLLGAGGHLHAYDAGTGERDWSVDADPVTPALSGDVLSTGLVGVDPTDGSVLWRFRAGDGVHASPAVVGNTVYAGSDDSHLYALAANTGGIEWTVATDGMVRGSPAVGEDAVYTGTLSGSLYAVDREDGTERWRVRVGSQVQSPTLVDGTVYVGNFSDTLFAFDAADGTEGWRTEVDGRDFVALTNAVGDGAVYAGANGDLRAFETADGTERWRATAGNRPVVQSVPVAAEGRVFVNMGDSLRAFGTDDGSEHWSRTTGGAHEPPAVHDGTVYAPGDGAVHAFDADDGTERWRTGVGNDLELAVGDGAVYGLTYDTPVIAFDREDGRVLWRHGGFEGTTSPALADEYLFVGDGRGRIRSIGPAPE